MTKEEILESRSLQRGGRYKADEPGSPPAVPTIHPFPKPTFKPSELRQKGRALCCHYYHYNIIILSPSLSPCVCQDYAEI